MGFPDDVGTARRDMACLPRRSRCGSSHFADQVTGGMFMASTIIGILALAGAVWAIRRAVRQYRADHSKGAPAGAGALFLALIGVAALIVGLSPSETPEQRAACLADAGCYPQRFAYAARSACSTAVENQAKYTSRWRDGERWPTLAAYDTKTSTIMLMGDAIELQNGFGAWRRMQYACIYSASKEAVTKLTVQPAG